MSTVITLERKMSREIYQVLYVCLAKRQGFLSDIKQENKQEKVTCVLIYSDKLLIKVTLSIFKILLLFSFLQLLRKETYLNCCLQIITQYPEVRGLSFFLTVVKIWLSKSNVSVTKISRCGYTESPQQIQNVYILPSQGHKLKPV